MRLKLLIITSLCLSISPIENVSTWQPCMPFCDTMCTGTAAISLTSNVASQYGSLSSQIQTNTQAVGRLSSSFMEQQASLYSQETIANQKRITAYDGVAKSINLTLEQFAVINERLIDHIAAELFNIKKNTRQADLVHESAKNAGVSDIPHVSNALVAAPELAKAIELHKQRAGEAILFQNDIAKEISAPQQNQQMASLIDDLDFEIPNPFNLTQIPEENWDEYQKLLTLVYNNKPKIEDAGLQERVTHIKNQFVLSVLTTALSKLVTIPDEKAETLLALTGDSKTNINKAMFETYKQELMNVNTQTYTKSAPVNSLLIINNLQLAQRNLILQEINNTKKLKNTLLAIEMY
ncbi:MULTISPECIES: hypothetical protein [Pseudoalteromonas]|uniref:hypothetical protein n=1 Tax=Pseudoalteromonas TaxID=53246 RepID=UPI00158309DF|nr:MULTISPECIES: hypothetical protein [Pseudoalteromonas]MDI4652582.1 hypothetical protein [Pseudoalteromonas shioyasakiensis]NUJ38710.1 hypothetical protein [Pseudoalteromonas sp. 0303]